MYKGLDLFSGIGGFSLGLEKAGNFKTVAFCEIDPFCQQVIARHWPTVPIYDDVHEISAARLIRDGIHADVITAGFPCTDVSKAGKMAGIHGEQSGLWAETARVIGDLRPRVAILENVANLISGESGKWASRVFGDLAALGFRFEWHCVPASAIGAHCHRDRIWVMAEPDGDGRDQGQPRVDQCQKAAERTGSPSWKERMSITPKMAEYIGRAINGAGA